MIAAIPKMHSIWMGDLDPYMDEVFVSSCFAAMGEPVANVKTIRLKTGGLAGYCFVEAATQTDAERIIQNLNGMPMPGTNPPKRFKLNWAMSGKEVPNQGTEYSIFVGDLTPEVTDLFLLTFFQLKYASVKAAKIVFDPTGRSRGYGFVRFFDEDEHKKALIDMQGAVGCGSRAIRVSPAIAKQKTYTYTTQQSAVAAAVPATQYVQYQYPQYAQYVPYDPQWYQQYVQVPDQMQAAQMDESVGVADTMNSADQKFEETLTDSDPLAMLNVSAVNKALIDQDNALFFELEASRWFSIDNYTTCPLPEITSS